MKLFYAPGACSLGIHLLLEEIGQPYERVLVNLREGAQFKPEFTGINPKSKVPTLQRDDGSVLTEFPAIAMWLAMKNPALMPKDADTTARAMEATDYAVATIHMQGFSRTFRPANFAPSEADHEAVKEKGLDIYRKGLANLAAALDGRDYVAGEFSFGDAAPFYVAFWGAERLKLELPGALAGHYARMKARPAVQRAMQAEGLV
ncbi:MAG TPA: glutathione S-transferase N-terminal domain-containing protein [Roseococcus sp.]|jgi:glutathione S-transferase|nr:glutathione S-transferase N-terminal domain-containing protein [Roseococcus sp.]